MASLWEKAISILARNLNLGRSYLITAVNKLQSSKIKHIQYSLSMLHRLFYTYYVVQEILVCLVFTVPDNINKNLMGLKILKTIFRKPTFCQKIVQSILICLLVWIWIWILAASRLHPDMFYKMIYNDFQICLPSCMVWHQIVPKGTTRRQPTTK